MRDEIPNHIRAAGPGDVAWYEREVLGHKAAPVKLMSRDAAIKAWRRLVAAYGLEWTARTPASAYRLNDEISKVLTVAEKRKALTGLY